jgi:hypothetical protein
LRFSKIGRSLTCGARLAAAMPSRAAPGLASQGSTAVAPCLKGTVSTVPHACSSAPPCLFAFRCVAGRRTPSSRRRSRRFFPVCRSPSPAGAEHRRTPPFPPPRRPAALHPPPVRLPRRHLCRTALPSPPAPVAKPRRRAIMLCGRPGYALRPPCTLGRCPGASGPRVMCRPPHRSCGRGPRGPYAAGP